MTRLLIEIFPRRNWLGRKEWRFRIKGANGEPLAQSEGYHNRSDAVATAQLLRARLFDAAVRSEDA
jgi:uncharacterized protein YegP (UPF0339 family)